MRETTNATGYTCGEVGMGGVEKTGHIVKTAELVGEQEGFVYTIRSLS